MNNARARNAYGVTSLAAVVAAGLTASAPRAAHAADVLLSGTIASAAGEKMGGVTVSAKADASLITTTVYTDEAGGYYFPPLPQGKYKVWAQAVTYQTAKGNVDLTKTTHQDFMLSPMIDQEDWVRQLPGDEFLA